MRSRPCSSAARGTAGSAPHDRRCCASDRRYPNRARRSIRRTGTTSARRVIACSMTCSTTPPTSASVRSGRRYRMRFARGFAPSFRAQPTDLGEVYREFTDFIVPYATGNVHPGFMGWVHGGGTAVGMLAEMLAAGLNANLGGRDHIPIEVERQVVEWTRAMFGFPERGERIFVTGTSMANLMAVLVARTAALGQSVRQRGVGERGRVADGLYVDGGAWLHRQGDGSRGLRQRCVAHDRGRSIASHRRRGIARADRRGPRRRPASRFSSSARPARWISARSTISRR